MSTPDLTTEKQTAPKAYHLGGNDTKFSNWRGLMFSIQHKTGDRVAYPYGYIQKIGFDKSGRLVVEMPTDKIVIEGLHLIELYYALVDHHVREIVESDAKYQAAPKGEAFIHTIKVINGETEEEQRIKLE